MVQVELRDDLAKRSPELLITMSLALMSLNANASLCIVASPQLLTAGS